MKRILLLAVVAVGLGTGCPSDNDDPSDNTDSTDTTDATDDTDVQIPIPDPGTGAADWFATGAMDTPETAWPVGVVTAAPPYIEGTAGTESEGAFYVFKAGASFDLELTVFGGAEIAFVHLHDGEGGVFGDELTPLTSTNTSGTWTVEADKVYVFEVHVDGGGFF